MNRPNIVFLHVDQLNLRSIGAYGGREALTPNMDRLIGRGVSFMHSCCTNPVCMPARTSWYTGLMSEEHGQITNGNEWAIDPAIPDLGQWLRDAGYDSVYLGKWHVSKPCRESFDVLHAGHGMGELGDSIVARNAAAFMNSRRGDKPFFLNIGLLNPHDICYWTFNPCGPGKFPLARDIERELPPLPPNHLLGPDSSKGQWTQLTKDKTWDAPPPGTAQDGSWSELDWRFYIYSYSRFVETVDEQIGRLYEAYLRSPGFENTIFILTSDHGESIGQHHHFTKNTLYDHDLLVPLVAVDPAIGKGFADTEHMVSGIDITATICDYAGVDPMPGTRGLSLRPLLRGESPEWRPYAAATTMTARQRILRTPTAKLINDRRTGRDKLFDLVTDPDEMTDVAGDPEYAEQLELLKGYMEENEAQYRYAPKVQKLIDDYRVDDAELLDRSAARPD